MIEWKEYDKDNTPEKGKEFLVSNCHSGWIEIAHIHRLGNWVERDDWTSVSGVTHYAEINLPEE